MIRVPRAQICKHLVAADILSLIIEHGGNVSSELAAAVVGAEDERALELLEKEVRWVSQS
jgi:hypothetical protein